MIEHLRPALVLTVLLTLLCGLAYPLSMTGLAQWMFPEQANGSLIIRNGTVIDGTGGPAQRADVAIDGERITAFGPTGYRPYSDSEQALLRQALAQGVQLAGRWQRGVLTKRPGVPQTGLMPLDALRHFFVDSLVHHPAYLDYLIAVMGADRIVFGSDWPFAPPHGWHKGGDKVTPYRELSYAELVDNFVAALPTDKHAMPILRDNPARLYGF